MQNVNKFINKYSKPKTSMEDLDSKQSPVETRTYALTPTIIHHDRNNSDSSDKFVFDQIPSKKEEENNTEDADQLMNNIVTFMKGDTEKEIVEEEENWSENDDTRDGVSLRKNSSQAQQTSAFDMKFFNPNRARKLTLSLKNLVKANKISRILSVNADSASSLLMKVKEKKNIRSGLPKLMVLKFISQIYLERIKLTGTLRETPLYIVCYDYFMNKYGLRKVAETKCQQMFESVMLYPDNRRIQRFRDFLGLGEVYESDELEIYFSTFKLLDPVGNGNIIASSLAEKTLIFFESVELAAITLFEKKIDPQNMKLLLARLNQLKIIDKNTKPMIEFEDAVEEFLRVQRTLQDKMKGFVKDIFNAADLDSDEIIVFFEFDILYKHLEKERYNKDKVKKLFFEQADFMLPDGSNERVVSFNKFAWICLEMGLFSEEKQRKFSRVTDPEDRIQTVQDLEENLKERLNEIRLRFMKSNTYDAQLKGIMTKLYNSVRNPLKPRNVVWLTYRLLDEESKHQLLNYEIKSIMPKELLIIGKFIEDYEDWSLE